MKWIESLTGKKFKCKSGEFIISNIEFVNSTTFPASRHGKGCGFFSDTFLNDDFGVSYIGPVRPTKREIRKMKKKIRKI